MTIERQYYPVQEAAARIAERARVFHLLSLHHLELGRIGAMAGYQQAHYQSVVGLKLSEESRKLDLALLKLAKERPDLKVEPTNNYSDILTILNKQENYHAQMDTRSAIAAIPVNPGLETLEEIIRTSDFLRETGSKVQCS